MKKLLPGLCLSALFVVIVPDLLAQTSTVQGVVVDGERREGIEGARVTLRPSKKGDMTDSVGRFEIRSVARGQYNVVVTRLGYKSDTVAIALEDSTLFVQVTLEPETQEEEIVISGTRTMRSISDVAIRVEAIPQEEVEEKIMMRPASVAMLLNESAGIHVQNTSGASNTANIRIQGLDGRYTQLLIDGIPSFSGMAAGFGITQLIPLNLRQVEIVKGANSGLYGPEAIAGVINFITKEPSAEPHISALLNATTESGYDASAFYSQNYDPLGLTLLASYNHQDRFDVDRDNFSDLAGYDRLTLTPKLTYAAGDIHISSTLSFFSEDRLGGVMNATRGDVGKPAPYLESNKTTRWNAATSFDWSLTPISTLAVRGAGMHLGRDSYYGATPFNGIQTFAFGDVAYTTTISEHTMLAGSAITIESFNDRTPDIPQPRSYSYNDLGVWLQDEIAYDQWKLLISGRFDHHQSFGDFFTPRASVMYKPLGTLSFRVGGGTGFKAPTIFLEEAEEQGFRNVQPINDVRAEQARSLSFDINYRFIFGDIAATFNAAVYGTNLDHALVLRSDSVPNSTVRIENADGLTTTRGAELNSQFTLDDFKLSVAYAYLTTEQHNAGSVYALELNPSHWLGVVLMYEDAALGIKAGIENYYTSPQDVEGDPFRTKTPSYWLNGFMIEKSFGAIKIFLNAENIFDVRQTRYEPTFLGDPATGDYRPLRVWAPLEGRAFNGGVRFVL
jgi:outer membrane receptor for ferrienterochelin and colicins